MAKQLNRSAGRQVHPTGGVFDLTDEERLKFKEKREELGISHRALAKKCGCSQATISNIETGRSGQVNQFIYMKAYVILFGTEPSSPAQWGAAKRIQNALAGTSPDNWDAIADLVESVAVGVGKLKNPR